MGFRLRSWGPCRAHGVPAALMGSLLRSWGSCCAHGVPAALTPAEFIPAALVFREHMGLLNAAGRRDAARAPARGFACAAGRFVPGWSSFLAKGVELDDLGIIGSWRGFYPPRRRGELGWRLLWTTNAVEPLIAGRTPGAAGLLFGAAAVRFPALFKRGSS